MNKTIGYFVLLLLISILSACGADQTNKEGKLTVYTTVFPLTDFTQKIGGEDVSVKSVYPPGADAHSFEPTPRDMTDIAGADAFIYTGVGVEGFVKTAQKTLKNEKVALFEAGTGIEFLHTEDDDHHDDEHNHGDIDPHIWLDPIYSIQIAENIKNALSEINPSNKELYERNFKELLGQLEALNTDFTEVTNAAKQKEILVAHSAYGYWEDRYGIKQISITGYSPTNEPSQKELKNIIDVVKEHNLKYILFERNISSKIAETVQKETGTESLTLHNLESLTEQEIESNEDYFSLMRQNLETLKKALN
ncbi:metal ABC transporter substrate-binding protein [Fredinandcohnia sp. QZ13]|uniref:metal ABC transporter substrate-binding protein n=1 Tax=Fredinandcohnia sp. QZ13 TaxID=3073144 RepID=UPI0028536CEF|nr:metal ABC transporter substrate-binding protein [Fredinandcohnia sp. QZ13]MDR4889334.1 metal ABC transporter substrate-binding protein [Fredinandcohnia sp. QZ13]